MAKKKDKINVVYSTNPNYEYEYDEKEVVVTLPPDKQLLKVIRDSKQRKGKVVTIVSGFIGDNEDLKELSKKLKNKCGCGGSEKDGEIILQGDIKEKLSVILKDMGYKAK